MIDDKLYLGNNEVEMKGDYFVIGGEEYEGTPGLWRLITLKNIEPQVCTPQCYETYS